MATKKTELAANQIIKSLETVDHILLRPSMYIGGVSPADHDVWMLNENDGIEFKKVNYVEGLLKICNEVIDNAIDEGIKTQWKYSTKIKIDITDTEFTCTDNGRGIPVVKTEDGKSWMCVDAVCKPMSGSNFTDVNRETIGTNGIGVKGANIFSKKFECITCDGKGKMKIVCSDNLKNEKHTELTPTPKTGTTITFTPDFERFRVKKFDKTLIALIKTRLKFLAWYFPECAITFNGERILFKAKDFSQMFPQPVLTINEPNAMIAVYPGLL